MKSADTWVRPEWPRVRRVWPFRVSTDNRGATTVTLPPSKPKRELAKLPDALF